MIKRIISLILCVAMILPAAAFAEEAAEVSYAKEIDFLSSVGVLNKEGFEPGSAVTRGKFAIMLANLLYNGIKAESALNSSFTDINSDSECYGAVSFLEGLKVVRGNTSGKFNPDSQITLIDAVVMVIRALGYDIYAQAEGGYTVGYHNVARKIFLTEQISWANSQLDNKTAAKLLYNALFVSSVEFSYMDDNDIQLSIDHSQDFLSRHMGIKLHKAQIIHDGMRSLDNSGLLENQMILKDLDTEEEILVDCSDLSYSEFFGCYVDAFIRYDESGKKELINCRLNNNVKITEVPAEDMLNPTLSSVEYEYGENGKTKEVRFDTSSVYIFVNGVKASRYSDAMVKSRFGFSQFIDNDADGKADVILVNDIERNIVVNSVSVENEVVLCKANGINSLRLSDKDKAYRVYKNGSISDIEAIETDDIVSVAASKEKIAGGITVYTLYASNATKIDVISGYNQNESVFSEETEYELSKLYIHSSPNLFRLIVSGNSYTLRFDAFGKVAWIDGISGSDVNYCYLLNVTQKSLFDEVKLYFYSKYAVFNELPFAKTVTVDGRVYKSGSESFKNQLITALNTRYDAKNNITEVISTANAAEYNHSQTAIVPRPAIIKVNGNGEIYYVDTDTPTYADTTLDEKDAYTLVAGERKLRETRFQIVTSGNPSLTDASFLITADTLVMQVADIDRYGIDEATYSHDYINLYELSLSDETNYKIMTKDDLSNYDMYDFQPYNIDPETGVAGFLLLRGYHLFHGPGNDKSTYTDLTTFTKLTEVYDDTGANREIYKLYYSDGAKEYSVKVDKNALSPLFHNVIFGGKILDYDASEPLQPGDIIKVHDEDGWLKAIRRYLDVSNINEKAVYTTAAGGPTYHYRKPNATQQLTSPYDNVMSIANTSLYNNYLYDLSLPVSASGLTIRAFQPYNAAGSRSNLKEYFTNNGGFTKFISVVEESMTKQIITVEETVHDPLGNCKFSVRKGSLADIKYLSSEGYYDATRLYTVYEVSEPKRFIIFNLKPEHNGQ